MKCIKFNKCFILGSPRAFVKYSYNGTIPTPDLFIQGKENLNTISLVLQLNASISLFLNITFLGVENSFPNIVVRKRFYVKYYQLLMHGQFPMKETKLCLVGPPDSGKTSWFSPFEGKYINNQ